MRWNRSARNVPCRTISSRLRCVATTTRASTGIGLSPPTRSISPFFQHAQQLGLHGERHVADFVQKKRAAGGLLEFSDVPRGRAGEGTFFVAEQFRFDQLGGHGGAIERHERPGAPRAFLVNRARDRVPCPCPFRPESRRAIRSRRRAPPAPSAAPSPGRTR